LGVVVINENDTKVNAIIPIILLPTTELKNSDAEEISINFISLTLNNIINGINSKINCLVNDACITSNTFDVST
jgi:hypothetical protein